MLNCVGVMKCILKKCDIVPGDLIQFLETKCVYAQLNVNDEYTFRNNKNEFALVISVIPSNYRLERYSTWLFVMTAHEFGFIIYSSDIIFRTQDVLRI